MRNSSKAHVSASLATLLLSLPFFTAFSNAQSSSPTRLSGAQTRVDTRISNSTTDTITQSDCGTLISYSSSSAIAATLPVAGALLSGCWMDVENTGAGTLTLTPTTSTIDGATSLVLTTNQGARIVDATTQYLTQRGQGSSSGGTSGGGTSGGGTTYSADASTLILTGTTFSANTAVVATRPGNGGQAGGDTNVVITSGSSTAYVGAPTGNPITVYTSGMRILAKIDVATAGAAITLDAGAGAKQVFQNDGASNPTATQWAAEQQVLLSYDGTLASGAGGWRILSGSTSTSSSISQVSAPSPVTSTFSLPMGGFNSNSYGSFPAWNVNGLTANTIAYGTDSPMMLLNNSGAPYVTSGFIWPSNWDNTKAVNVIVVTGSNTSSSGVQAFNVSFSCLTGAAFYPAAYGPVTTATITVSATFQTTTLSNVNTNSCTAGAMTYIKIARDNTISGNSGDPLGLSGVAIQWTNH